LSFFSQKGSSVFSDLTKNPKSDCK